jgi:homoserine O-succinyltransferase
MPVSRWTEMKRDEIDAAGLKMLLHSDGSSALVEDLITGALYVFNHFEYDSDTLNQYLRDSWRQNQNGGWCADKAGKLFSQ